MPKKRSKVGSLPVIEPNAAGIDVGATEIFVAVPADRDAEPVRCFPTFTIDLERLADWLQQCHIRHRGHGIDRSVLDSAVPDPGEAQNRRATGQRPSCQERAGQEDRCFKTASGFSTFIPWGYCEDPFARMTKSARSVRCGVIATTSFS